MRALLVVTAFAVASAGCRRSTPKPAAVDASVVDASAAVVDGGGSGPGVYLVAYSSETELESIQTIHTDDGRWVINTGALFYEPRVNGALALVGHPIAYRSLYRGHDAVGHGRRLWTTGYVVSDERDGLLFVENSIGYGKVKNEKPRAVTFAGREIITRPLRMSWHGEAVRIRGRWLGFDSVSHRPAWLDGDATKDAPAAPPDHALEALRIAKDGTLYAFGSRATDHARVVLSWRADAPLADPPRTITLPPGDTCSPLTSADGKVYVRCGPMIDRGRATYVRLDGDHTVPMFETMTAAKGIGLHVGADGALYGSTKRDKGEAVLRCPADRAPCVMYEPRPSLGPATDAPRKSYRTFVGQAEIDAWNVTIGDVDVPAPGFVKDIFARGPDDIWVSYDERSLYHSGPARTHARLLSPVDQLVLVDNAGPIEPWVGHCNQIFVRVLRAKDVDAGKSVDITKVAAPPEIDGGHPYSWEEIDGFLGGERVAGIGFFLGENEQLEQMEAAARRVIESFTLDPASPPLATCTLPVLAQ